MKKALNFFRIFLIILASQINIYGQPVVNFILPDSSCVGSPISITNLTTGGSTFYWNFCSGNANNDPIGVNFGNPGNLLDVPTYITLIKDGNDCYSFISCQFAGVIRYYHGTSFSHTPISWTNLGTFGLLGNHVEGIQVKKENGNWYGFVCNNTTLVRLDFGVSLANTPTAIDLGPFTGLTMLHGLVVIKEDTTWVAFAVDSFGFKFVRFDFGNSLTNVPTLTDFGNFGILIQPGAICLVQENLLWYGLILDGVNLIRLTFGASLLNAPTAENLGNPGGFNSALGLSIIRDCDLTSGYFVNYLTNGQLGKLIFTGGVTGTVTGEILGNIGNLNKPHSFSVIFRQNDTLFSYITNRGSNTLTLLTFPPCNNASVPSSTQFNPPPFSYNQQGTYNVRLIVNEGMPDQVSLCKIIVIGPVPTVDLGPDTIICSGTSITLDAGPGFTTYLWSTGDTSRTITVFTGGNYWVTVTKSGCQVSDTMNVAIDTINPVNLGPDTTVCLGEFVTFDAGPCTSCTYLWTDLSTGLPVGTGQTFTTSQAGIYKATVTSTMSCQESDTVQLSTIATAVVTNDPLAKTICSGNSTDIVLTSNISGATFSWIATGSSPYISGYTDGSGDTINQVLTNSNVADETVIYTITPFNEYCPGIPANYVVTVTPSPVVGITITASANDICPGSPVTFTAHPVNGGISPSFRWHVNGNLTGPDTMVFIYVPANHDSVYCILNSDLDCSSGNPATSNIIAVTFFIVNPVNLGPDTTICPGDSVSFDAGPCTGCLFLWSNLTTGQQNIGTGQTLTTADTGLYRVAVTDANSCFSQDTIHLLNYNYVNPDISGDSIPCNDTVTYFYLTEAGMSNYQWSVSPGGTIISGMGTNQIGVKWTIPGSQMVFASYTSAEGCPAPNPATYPVRVFPVPGPAGTIYGPTELCPGYTNPTFTADPIQFAQSYIWQLPSGYQVIAGQNTSTITVSFDDTANSGDLLVYGNNQCGDGPLSPPFHFTILEPPVVDAGPDQSIPYDSSAMLNGSISDQGVNYIYAWQPLSLVFDNTLLNPRTINLTHDTLFFLYVTDTITGCNGTDSVRIRVFHQEIIEDCLVFHNVITPNGDGLNDKWVIDCIENFPENTVTIFNTWGDKINHFDNYDNVSQVWKGTNRNGQPMPDGTYYYILTIKNGGKYSGWILIR